MAQRAPRSRLRIFPRRSCGAVYQPTGRRARRRSRPPTTATTSRAFLMITCPCTWTCRRRRRRRPWPRRRRRRHHQTASRRRRWAAASPRPPRRVGWGGARLHHPAGDGGKPLFVPAARWEANPIAGRADDFDSAKGGDVEWRSGTSSGSDVDLDVEERKDDADAVRSPRHAALSPRSSREGLAGLCRLRSLVCTSTSPTVSTCCCDDGYRGGSPRVHYRAFRLRVLATRRYASALSSKLLNKVLKLAGSARHECPRGGAASVLAT